MSIFSRVTGWFGFGGSSLGQNTGKQLSVPSVSLVEDTPAVGVDAALQISSVWGAVSLIANLISTLPLFVFEGKKGVRDLARESGLWQLLHENPNNRMTPCEFWTAMLLNLLFRGNAYARVDRTKNGEAYALWPMSADQVEVSLLADGNIVYLYRVGADVAALAAESVLHIKGMGNGNIGLARLDYMKATTSEAKNSQTAANKLFANGGKPTGVLMLDQVLNADQRKSLQERFSEMANGTTSRLYVLEAKMQYQQINMTPEDIQLLSTRQFTVQEIGRWFGVPSILINQTEGTTTLGSSSGEIIESFYKLTIRPMIVSIEQSIRKRVLSPAQRVIYTAEFSFDALLRSNLKDRMEIYAKAGQNGIFSRNECRQFENMPPVVGGDELTAQTNLAPLHMLGKIKPAGGANGTQNTINQ